MRWQISFCFWLIGPTLSVILVAASELELETEDKPILKENGRFKSKHKVRSQLVSVVPKKFHGTRLASIDDFNRLTDCFWLSTDWGCFW